MSVPGDGRPGFSDGPSERRGNASWSAPAVAARQTLRTTPWSASRQVAATHTAIAERVWSSCPVQLMSHRRAESQLSRVPHLPELPQTASIDTAFHRSGLAGPRFAPLSVLTENWSGKLSLDLADGWCWCLPRRFPFALLACGDRSVSPPASVGLGVRRCELRAAA